MSVVGFVPARSGSKRVPNKNIRDLAGKPLVVWTLEAMLGVESIEKVIFSTDSDAYWDAVRKCLPDPRLVLSKRDPEDAGDQVKIFDYLLRSASDLFSEEDVVVMGLPTIPFRTSEDIARALELHRSSGNAVFSACEYEFPVSFAFTSDVNSCWTPVFDSSPMVTGNTRSQDQAKCYHPNGAIYVRPAADLIGGRIQTLYQDATALIMNRGNSLDIDDEFDFAVAEALFVGRAASGSENP